jgi:hypothetical protein
VANDAVLLVLRPIQDHDTVDLQDDPGRVPRLAVHRVIRRRDVEIFAALVIQRDLFQSLPLIPSDISKLLIVSAGFHSGLEAPSWDRSRGGLSSQ